MVSDYETSFEKLDPVEKIPSLSEHHRPSENCPAHCIPEEMREKPRPAVPIAEKTFRSTSSSEKEEAAGTSERRDTKGK